MPSDPSNFSPAKSAAATLSLGIAPDPKFPSANHISSIQILPDHRPCFPSPPNPFIQPATVSPLDGSIAHVRAPLPVAPLLEPRAPKAPAARAPASSLEQTTGYEDRPPLLLSSSLPSLCSLSLPRSQLSLSLSRFGQGTEGGRHGLEFHHRPVARIHCSAPVQGLPRPDPPNTGLPCLFGITEAPATPPRPPATARLQPRLYFPYITPAFRVILVRAENERTLPPRFDPLLGRVQHAKAQRLYSLQPACWPNVSSRPAPPLCWPSMHQIRPVSCFFPFLRIC